MSDKNEEAIKLEKIINEFANQEDDQLTVAYTNILNEAFGKALKGFGITDNLSEEDTQKKLLEKEIQIVEITEPHHVAGFYICQGFKNPVFRIYISYPYKSKEGKLVVMIEDYSANRKKEIEKNDY